MSEIDFNEHLKSQLGYLERSCQSFDEGHHDEAIRIATTIRTLIHQTDNSTSLLTHLNSNAIELLSTIPPANPDLLYEMGIGTWKISADKQQFFPTLGDGWFKQSVPATEWWDQLICVLNPETKLARKEVVLRAANKDGGAHVASSLPAGYAALKAEGAAGYFIRTVGGKQVREPIINVHLIALRQMAYELLNSEQLTGLAT